MSEQKSAEEIIEYWYKLIYDKHPPEFMSNTILPQYQILLETVERLEDMEQHVLEMGERDE